MNKKFFVVCSLLFFQFFLYSSAKADHTFTNIEKEKVLLHVTEAVSKIGINLAVNETIVKGVNKHIIAEMLVHVLSRSSDEAVASFLALESKELNQKLIKIIGAYKARNSLEIFKKYKSAKSFFKVNKFDFIFVVTDIFIEFIKLEIVKNEAWGLLADLLYSDLKAYIKLI